MWLCDQDSYSILCIEWVEALEIQKKVRLEILNWLLESWLGLSLSWWSIYMVVLLWYDVNIYYGLGLCSTTILGWFGD